MVADRKSGIENDDFLSMMRTLASLAETSKLRGDTMSAGIFSSVAALLAEVHVARVPDVGGYDKEGDAPIGATALA